MSRIRKAGDHKTKTRNLILISVGICLVVGLLGAYSIASEPIAYIASMSYGILVMFVLFPAIILLFIGAIASASLGKAKYAVALFLSCLMLPLFFFGGLQVARSLGLARYETPGFNDMRPIGSELKNRIVLTFKKTASQDEISRFDKEILRKSVPQPDGILLAFADGVCNFSYPQTSPDVTIVNVPFCKDATEEQKAVIREKIVSSPLVHTAFEDIDSGEVKKLK